MLCLVDVPSSPLFGVEMEHGGSQGEDSVEIDWGEEGRKHSQNVIYEIRIKKYKKGTNLCVLILYLTLQ